MPGSQAQATKDYDCFVFTGANQDVEKVIQYIESLYNDEKNHVIPVPLAKPLHPDVLRELQNEIGVRYNVDIQQSGHLGRITLSIRGRRCHEAEQDLLPILSNLSNLNMPADWKNTAT